MKPVHITIKRSLPLNYVFITKYDDGSYESGHIELVGETEQPEPHFAQVARELVSMYDCDVTVWVNSRSIAYKFQCKPYVSKLVPHES